MVAGVSKIKTQFAGLFLVALFALAVQIILSKLSKWDTDIAGNLQDALKDKRTPEDQRLIVEASRSTYFVLVIAIGLYAMAIAGICVAALILGPDTVSFYLGSSRIKPCQQAEPVQNHVKAN